MKKGQEIDIKMGSGSQIVCQPMCSEDPDSGGRRSPSRNWFHLLTLSLVVGQGGLPMEGNILEGIISQVLEEFGGNSNYKD